MPPIAAGAAAVFTRWRSRLLTVGDSRRRAARLAHTSRSNMRSSSRGWSSRAFSPKRTGIRASSKALSVRWRRSLPAVEVGHGLKRRSLQSVWNWPHSELAGLCTIGPRSWPSERKLHSFAREQGLRQDPRPSDGESWGQLWQTEWQDNAKAMRKQTMRLLAMENLLAESTRWRHWGWVRCSTRVLKAALRLCSTFSQVANRKSFRWLGRDIWQRCAI